MLSSEINPNFFCLSETHEEEKQHEQRQPENQHNIARNNDNCYQRLKVTTNDNMAANFSSHFSASLLCDTTTDKEFKKLAAKCVDYRRKCLLFQRNSIRNVYDDTGMSLNDLNDAFRDGKNEPSLQAKDFEIYPGFNDDNNTTVQAKKFSKNSTEGNIKSMVDLSNQSSTINGEQQHNHNMGSSSLCSTSTNSPRRREANCSGHCKSKKKRIIVRGKRHTYMHIIKGETMMVQCPGCTAILQVGNSAKYVYCGNCNSVSPVKNKVHPAGRAETNIDDEVIARKLQEQEIDLARARSLAKSHNLSADE